MPVITNVLYGLPGIAPLSAARTADSMRSGSLAAGKQVVTLGDHHVRLSPSATYRRLENNILLVRDGDAISGYAARGERLIGPLKLPPLLQKKIMQKVFKSP